MVVKMMGLAREGIVSQGISTPTATQLQTLSATRRFVALSDGPLGL